MARIIQWIGANYQALGAVALIVIATVQRLTAWGQAKSKALTAIAGAIESLEAGGVKALVAERVAELPPAVQRAVADAVNTVDPQKPNPTPLQVFLREILP